MAGRKHFGSELPTINGRSLDLKYIWNVNGLVRELREGTLKSEERFAYLLWLSFIPLIASYLFPTVEVENAVQLAEWLVTDTVLVVALLLCYQTNRKGDDREFIERFVCLCLPVSFRVGVILVPIWGLIMLLIKFALGSEPGDWFWFASNVSLAVVVAWQLRAAFVAVSRVEPVQAAS